VSGQTEHTLTGTERVVSQKSAVLLILFNATFTKEPAKLWIPPRSPQQTLSPQEFRYRLLLWRHLV